jgi:hypothetical protein
MESKYIEEVVKDFLTTKETNFAILINGSWGSGKTHFWKNKLSKHCEKAQLKPIYLSLNGLNKIETLDYQLKIKLIPLLNKLAVKKSASLGKLAKNALFQLLKGKYNVDAESILKDVEIDLSDFSSKVICFDDLERCKIPLSEVLGYVNDFVEHKNLKVLFLSDESKIDTKNDENYNSIKEKVVGRVLSYKNNLIETLPLLFSKYEKTNNEFYNFLIEKEPLIYDYLLEFKEENLRNISFYLECLSKCFTSFKEHLDYTDEVIYFTLVFTIEFKSGILTSNDYTDFKGYDDINSSLTAYNFSKPNNDDEKPKTRLGVFHEKYIKKDRLRYNFYPSIYQFILTGYLNTENFNLELESRHPVQIPEHIKAYSKLLDYKFRHLKNVEFQELFELVFENAKEGKYSIYEYYRISIFFNFFSDNKLIEQTVAENQKTLLKGIKKAGLRQKINERQYESVFHFRKKDEGDEIIVQAIKDTHDLINTKRDARRTNKLIEALIINNLLLVKKIFQDYNLQKELFRFIEPTKLFKTLLSVENVTIVEFKHQLESRYNSVNIKDFLSQDFDFLAQLNTLITEKFHEKEVYQVQGLIFRELSKSIEEICENLK